MEKHTGLTDRIRRIASDMERFTIRDLCKALRYKSRKKTASVTNSMRYLKRKGEVKAIRPGLYHYEAPIKPLTKTARMWRAIRIKEYFTKRDIVLLTEVSRHYANQYVKSLERDGHVSRVSGRGYAEAVYCLENPDKAPLDAPPLRPKKARD